MIPAPTKATDSAEIAERLAETRERTLLLIEQLDDEQLNTVYSPLLSPLAWDLGHIANFEELWLVQTAGGREPLNGDLGRLYDAIENPRASRNELPILRGTELRAYMDEVRERALEVLDGIDLEDAPDPVIRDGFAYEMLIAHEQQHNETMLQLLQMVDGYEPPLASPPAAEPDRGGPATIAVAGGGCEVGAGAAGFAYDNERPRHEVEVAPFRIDRLPVSNADFAAFVAATGAEPPLYWERDGAGGWVDSRFGRQAELDPAAPVIHVDQPTRVGLRGVGGEAAADRDRVGGRRRRLRPRRRQPRPRRIRDATARCRDAPPAVMPWGCSETSGNGPARS